MKIKILLPVLTAACLQAGAVAAAAESQDQQALRDLLAQFEVAYGAKDKAALRKLYSTDGMYFQRSGREAFGSKSVADLMFAPRERPSGPPLSNPKIIMDGSETADRLGYMYGRVCGTTSAGAEHCGTRWFLVLKRNGDNQWRIHADMDMPLKETLRD